MSYLPIITDCKGCGACCGHLTLPPFASYDADDFEF